MQSHDPSEKDRGGWEVLEEGRSKEEIKVERKRPTDNGLDKHMENFISVVRSKKLQELNCSVETGTHIATITQLGNIAFHTQQKLLWDQEKEKFTDDKVNDKYLNAKYHNGYKLPKV